MKIWIDNDGCSNLVRDMIFATSQRRAIPIVVVGNKHMHVPGGLISMVTVSGDFDAADNYIAEHVEVGDLVITSDVPLAGRVVPKGAFALSARGEVFDAQTIGERLTMRNLMQELRSAGEIRGGPPPPGPMEKKKFADALDRLVSKLLRENPHV